MSKYGFEAMNIGDTLSFRNDGEYSKSACAAKSFFRKHGWKIKVQKTKACTFITRKDGPIEPRVPQARRGNMPDASQGWSEATVCKDALNALWGVYFQEQHHTPEWVNFKVVALDLVSGRANYRFNYNLKTGTIGYARDFFQLKSDRQEVYYQVEEVIKRMTENIFDLPCYRSQFVF